MYAKKSNKKAIILVALVLVLAIGAIFGTVAWLTAEDSETNIFTVGNVEEPGVGPELPTGPNDVDPTAPTEDPNAPTAPDDYEPAQDGNLFEPWWEDGRELVPGADIAKDPYVGVGEGSVASYVFVEVENLIGKDVTFKLNNGWAPVENEVVAGTAEGTYQSGIFVYVGTNTDGKYATLDGYGENDVEQTEWTTTPVFSYISVSTDATYESLVPNGTTDTEGVDEKNYIIVNAFIHQAVDGNNEKIPQETALEAAVKHFEMDTDPDTVYNQPTESPAPSENP